MLKNAACLPGHLSNMHGDKKNLPCQFCRKEFNLRGSLRNHVKYVHSATTRERIPCKFHGCDKKYLNKTSLVSHYKTDHDENYVPFRCTLCPKEFKMRGDLMQHIGTHTGERSFKCKTCGRSFGKMRTLRKHEVCK